MSDWRGDLMGALIDMRQEARYDDWGDEMIALEQRIDRAVQEAMAQAWDEGSDASAYFHETNPYRADS